jgi:hypothetical protein
MRTNRLLKNLLDEEFNDAQTALGDEVAVTQQRFEEIPYTINERIRWFLNRHGGHGAAPKGSNR